MASLNLDVVAQGSGEECVHGSADFFLHVWFEVVVFTKQNRPIDESEMGLGRSFFLQIQHQLSLQAR